MAETSGGGEGDMPTEYRKQGPYPHRKLRLDQLFNVTPFICQVVTASFSDLPQIVGTSTIFGLISTDTGVDFTCSFIGSWN